jgi:hypothetical protein
MPGHPAHDHVAEPLVARLGSVGTSFDRPPTILEALVHEVGHLIHSVGNEGPAVDVDERPQVFEVGVVKIPGLIDER